MTSKLEYLKRYLSDDKPKKAKKKKAKTNTKTVEPSGFRVIDDDIELHQQKAKKKRDLYDADRPVIVARVDEMPAEIIDLEDKQISKKWKVVSEVSEESIAKLYSEAGEKLGKGSVKMETKAERIKQEPVAFSRRNRHDSDSESDKNNDSDLSPQRKDQDSDDDLSPPRPGRTDDDDDDLSPPRDSSGLSSAAQLRKDIEHRRRMEEKQLKSLKDSESGRNATTVFRQRGTGKKRDLQSEAEKKRQQDAINKAKDEQYAKWAKGLRQAEQQEAAVNEAVHEMNKPLARYRDDQDLNDHRRHELRKDDPMRAAIERKRQKAVERTNPSRPRYTGPDPPPNRYNIWPGCRWDGVDRSNGFERRYFESLSNRQAQETDSYKYSTYDY